MEAVALDRGLPWPPMRKPGGATSGQGTEGSLCLDASRKTERHASQQEQLVANTGKQETNDEADPQVAKVAGQTKTRAVIEARWT